MIRSILEDLFAAACWLATFAALTLWIVAVMP